MARTRTTFFDRVQTLLSQSKQATLLFLAALMVALTPSLVYSQDLLQQGHLLYQNGRYQEAVTVLQQAAQQSGDPLRQALALSNLSLVYQALSQWDQAQQAIDTSLNLLQSSPPAPHQKAQALEVRGQLALSTGKAQTALEDWRSAAQLFEQNGDRVSASRTRLHQTLALQQLGLYRESFTTLQKPPLEFNDKDSDLKVTCLRSLSNTIRKVGTNLLGESDQEKQLKLLTLGEICDVSDLPDLKENENSNYLKLAEKLLEKAQALVDDHSISAEILLDLGNLRRDAYYRAKDAYERVKTPAEKQEIPELITSTLGFDQQAIDQPISWIQLQSKLNQFMFLIEVDRWLSVTSEPAFVSIAQEVNSRLKVQRPNLSTLLNQLEKLPAGHTTFQMRLNLVHSLLPSSTEGERKVMGALLTQTEAEAKKLGDRVTQSYAVGYLGRLQENQQHWQQAYEETNRSLKLTEDLQQPKLAYEWQWQQGRILREMGNRQAAIAAYETAIKSLDTVRQDLLGLGNPDLQFSFRDRMEPVYRELIELLLTENGAKPRNRDLQTARKTIADLQVAQLENYLRCTLQIKDPVELDAVADQHNTAIIYPILLPQQLALIVRTPKAQTLQYRFISVSQAEAVGKLKKFRESSEKVPQTNTDRKIAQEVYEWLFKPVEALLSASPTPVKTLVFVPDTQLQKIPMAALLDRSGQYLIEKYAIALNLSLQLEKPQPLRQKPLTIMAAGLSQQESGLKHSEAELNILQQKYGARKLLDKQFTLENWQQQLNSYPFTIVHVVTHGEFTSDLETTGLRAMDKRLIKLNDLQNVFQIQNQRRPEPVEMLVLSACRTAAGDTRAALGMAGVAVRSGARSTVASLWYSDDGNTTPFMQQFYEALASSERPSKAEALQRTQKLFVRDNQPPRYWAQFVLLGNWL